MRPKHWVAVLVRMCTEKVVGERLDKLGVENYVPVQTEIHQWSDRKKKVERVVIPMIVFIRVAAGLERQLVKYSFVSKVLTYPGQNIPAIIPDIQIDRLKFMLNHADTNVELRNVVFEIGDKVQIARGPLKGLEGELCYLELNRPMVAVRIECLGYACVNVAKTDIEPATGA